MGGTYETACRGKDKHRNKHDADNQAVKRRGSHLHSNKKLNSYRCVYCHYWHVGNSSVHKRRPYKRTKPHIQW